MKATRAFSLIEVVLALGLFSFVIVCLVGLMTVGLQDGKESGTNLALGLMTENVVTRLRLEGFAGARAKAGYGAGDTTPDFYFDRDGGMALAEDGSPDTAPATDSLYACLVSRRTPVMPGASEVVFLQLKFSWPLQAPVANRQTQVVLVSLSNRD